MPRGCQRKAARARWKKYRTRFDPKPDAEPGEMIGPVEADFRHGYVKVKANGMGYCLVHPAQLQRDA